VPTPPEYSREWTTLSAEEIKDTFVGLYPLLRAEGDGPSEELLPDLEDILGGLLPLEM
jgi:hypothetical protein